MFRALIALVVVGCGGTISDVDASANGDAAVDALDEIVDASPPDGFDDAYCGSDTIGWTSCTDAAQAYCETWALNRAYGAVGHSICENGTCTLGDYCPTNEPCRCSPTVSCTQAQVCYSDTPDGATHCKAACTPSP